MTCSALVRMKCRLLSTSSTWIDIFESIQVGKKRWKDVVRDVFVQQGNKA